MTNNANNNSNKELPFWTLEHQFFWLILKFAFPFLITLVILISKGIIKQVIEGNFSFDHFMHEFSIFSSHAMLIGILGILEIITDQAEKSEDNRSSALKFITSQGDKMFYLFLAGSSFFVSEFLINPIEIFKSEHYCFFSKEMFCVWFYFTQILFSLYIFSIIMAKDLTPWLTKLQENY